jgi:hypothetical protein
MFTSEEWISALSLVSNGELPCVSASGSSATAGDVAKHRTKPIPAGPSLNRRSVPDLDMPSLRKEHLHNEDDTERASSSVSSDRVHQSTSTPRLIDSDPPPPSLPSSTLLSKSVVPKSCLYLLLLLLLFLLFLLLRVCVCVCVCVFVIVVWRCCLCYIFFSLFFLFSLFPLRSSSLLFFGMTVCSPADVVLCVFL